MSGSRLTGPGPLCTLSHEGALGRGALGAHMLAYRVFTFDEDTHIVGVPAIIECENDQAAIEAAKQLLNGKALEIWQLNRRVARLEPTDSA